MALLVYSLIFALAIQTLNAEGVHISGTSGDAEKKIDHFINNLLKLRDVPGAIFAAVQGGKVFMSKGYGKADVTKNVDMTKKTLLNIGSITKSFNGVLLAKLMGQNQK